MTIRIEEPNLWHTETLLGQVLTPIIKHRQRVLFLAPAGEGCHIVQRLRVMISRNRKTMEARGRAVRKFRLHSSIHTETHEGTRYDAIVLWQSVSEIHLMSETLEDLLAHG